MLAGEEAHADAGEVEAVEELAEVEPGGGVGAAALLRGELPRVQLLQTAGDERLDVVVLLHDGLEGLAELGLESYRRGHGQAAEYEEAALVQPDDLGDGGGLAQAVREPSQLADPPAARMGEAGSGSSAQGANIHLASLMGSSSWRYCAAMRIVCLFLACTPNWYSSLKVTGELCLSE